MFRINFSIFKLLVVVFLNLLVECFFDFFFFQIFLQLFILDFLVFYDLLFVSCLIYKSILELHVSHAFLPFELLIILVDSFILSEFFILVGSFFKIAVLVLKIFYLVLSLFPLIYFLILFFFSQLFI